MLYILKVKSIYSLLLCKHIYMTILSDIFFTLVHSYSPCFQNLYLKLHEAPEKSLICPQEGFSNELEHAVSFLVAGIVPCSVAAWLNHQKC